MLRDELKMLEVRLREFEDKPVYRHLVIESPVTHRGDAKPLCYAENKELFAPWADRIIHVIADLPDTGSPWLREHAQRTAMWPALDKAGIDPDDVILFGDVDEFPPAEAFTRLPEPAFAHEQAQIMYAADWLYPHPLLCSVSARAGWARQPRYCPHCKWDRPGCATAVRDYRNDYPRLKGGMHLSWLGGLEGHRTKLGVHCHTEMTASEYDRIWSGACYERGVHHGDGGLMMIPVDVDESWPKAIYEDWCRISNGEPPEVVPANWFRPRPVPALGSPE